MTYKKFCKTLAATINEIEFILGDSDFKYKQVGPSFSIKIPSAKVDKLKDDIKSIVSSNFDGKSSKFCKFNYHDSKLFVQFKRRVL